MLLLKNGLLVELDQVREAPQLCRLHRVDTARSDRLGQQIFLVSCDGCLSCLVLHRVLGLLLRLAIHNRFGNNSGLPFGVSLDRGLGARKRSKANAMLANLQSLRGLLDKHLAVGCLVHLLRSPKCSRDLQRELGLIKQEGVADFALQDGVCNRNVSETAGKLAHCFLRLSLAAAAYIGSRLHILRAREIL